MGDEVPPQRQYKYPVQAEAGIEKIIQSLEQGVIEKGNSSYDSPIWPVLKASGNWRLTVDFRQINKVTPLPSVVPTVADLLQAYENAEPEEDSNEVLVTQWVRELLIELKKMEFKLTDAIEKARDYVDSCVAQDSKLWKIQDRIPVNKIAPRIMADKHPHTTGEIIEAPTIVDETIWLEEVQVNISAQHPACMPYAWPLLQVWQQQWGHRTKRKKRGIREYIIGSIDAGVGVLNPFDIETLQGKMSPLGQLGLASPPSQLDQDTQVQDMDESQIVPPPPETPTPPPLPPTPGQVIVRKDYDTKASKPLPPAPAPDEYFVSPITGEKIPASKMQEHMIGLLDPRWLEQRDRSIREKQSDDKVYAPGLDIESSLKQLAERRTGIFGVEETAIGKKIGEEEIQKPEEKVTWDGHSGSMARTQQAAQANITLQEQIEAIHKAKGLVPEDDSKEKIGLSKPNEMPQPLPPSTASNPPFNAPPITSVPCPPSMPPPVCTTVVSAVPRPPMTSVVRIPPGSVITVPMPPIIHAPRINVVPMPPSGPPMMVPRPPPMIVPTAFVPAPPVAPVPAPAPIRPHPPPPMEDEPVSKKPKSEDSLMPEEEFLRRNKGPVTVNVQVPNMQDKTEWKPNGQVLVFTLPLSDQVSVIKVKIHEATGMPARKQKLQYEGIFIKDSNSLAYYNMISGSVIHSALKGRGGRKK
ncbi:LOW QUALITY PROTEIN: splicing factor 3A subunit 1-like [Pangshura tecta]